MQKLKIQLQKCHGNTTKKNKTVILDKMEQDHSYFHLFKVFNKTRFWMSSYLKVETFRMRFD